MTKILVTGCAGFIGGNFVRLLLGKSFLNKGYGFSSLECEEIIGVDAMRIGSSVELISELKKNKKFTFYKYDICDSESLKQVLDKHKPDMIVNFAAESHVDRSIDSSDAFVHSNVIGTVNLLELSRDRSLRYLQVSTDEVYGELGETGSFFETTPLAPNSPYSASKAAADCFVRSFVHTHKVDAVITRCSNNYGPHQYPEKFIPVVVTKALGKQKIPVYGSGLNVRDWLHVEDHCWGIFLALTKGKPGEVYNFGGYGERNNLQVAYKILEILKKDKELISFVEDRKGHDWRYSINSTKAQSELGWKPLWSFDEGLENTVEWYVSKF
ncbi:MAG: dTDP-glucose 4,6-dehydratase [bacterium]